MGGGGLREKSTGGGENDQRFAPCSLCLLPVFLQMRLDLWQGHQDGFCPLELEHRLCRAGQILVTDKEGQLRDDGLDLDVHKVNGVAEDVGDLEPVQALLRGDQLEVVDAQVHVNGLFASEIQAVLLITHLLEVGHDARSIDLTGCAGNVTKH
ncbi:MAG: hypothetical protein BYD32DRAFT_420923 [Podila humilis]|nr:MAG: hypothetical protein BYD32DRAFT_420923 [Podila humilis]